MNRLAPQFLPLLEKKFTGLGRAQKTEFYGMTETGKQLSLPFFIQSLLNKKKSILLVCESEKIAKDYASTLEELGIGAKFFPQKAYTPYGVLSQSLETEKIRQGILKQLLAGELKVVTMSFQGLNQNLAPKEEFLQRCLSLKQGETISRIDLQTHLLGLGYEAVKIVENEGEFAFRGEVLDIFPIGETKALRLNFFDDEIEDLAYFEVASQRRLPSSSLSEVTLAPVLSIYQSDEIFLKAKEAIQTEIKRLKSSGKTIDQAYFDKILSDELGFKNQGDLFLPFFYDHLEGLVDYFSETPVIMIENLTNFDVSLNKAINEDEVQTESLRREGQFLEKQSMLFLTKERVKSYLKKYDVMAYSYLPKLSEFVAIEEKVYSVGEDLITYHDDRNALVTDLKAWLETKAVIFTYQGDEERENLVHFLKDNGLKYTDTLKKGHLALYPSALALNYHWQDMDVVFLSYEVIFSKMKKTSSRQTDKENRGEFNLDDLELGDYIVHENHGIGIYAGVEHITLQDSENDYLVLQYKGNDRLLIPIAQVKHLQKYHGDDTKAPKVTNLNSKEWVKTKAKVKGAIEDIAHHLLKTSAERKLKEGISFLGFKEEEERFFDSFPYVETPDQLKAIEDTLADMTRPYPMDRLICGDVGYGKTEVAIRASYRAVLNLKQVLILVPTTVLCQQHYRTFTERFSKFEVKIEEFSRFTSKKDEKQILQDLAEHKIDILIATHKALSDKVNFSDLGLLVIDEEQRFGVKHKEKIKALKTDVDILTLSATPIPRTLHMSMVGLRDVSLIETPPKNRHPIQTYIIEHDLMTISQAIQKEVARGGQVFYVRNRIDALDDILEKLRKSLPHVKIGLAHGQMSEKEIDTVMLAFMNKEIDVLLSTTIIETGIDIANANTLIVEYADTLGLSQLYQLRGRVGRSHQVAYAYLTYAKNRYLTEVSEKRLMALRQYTALGSGYKIALKDLKIRGSGNILGKEQSGQMLSVGFELYMYMLEETINQLKGIEKVSDDVELNLQVSAYIPSDYIKENALRLSLYRKIYGIANLEELKSLYYDTLDRFGDLPSQLLRLFSVMKVKIYAKEAFIKALSKGEKGYYLNFYHEKLSDEKVRRLMDYLLQGKLEGSFMERNGEQVFYLLVKKIGDLDELSAKLKAISMIVKND